LLVLKLIKFC